MINLFQNNRFLSILLGFALAGLMILQLHNSFYHPVERGFDAIPHAEYIQYIQNNGEIPTAKDGWEMYQPPLYYLLGTVVGGIPLLKFVHLVYLNLLLYSGYTIFNKITKDRLLAVIGIVLLGALPVVVYMTPPITNEFFSAVMISAVLAYYIIHRKLKKTSEKVILGILLALAIASKATAFVVAASIALDAIWQHKKNIVEPFKKLSVSFILMTGLGGWYYFRNVQLYGNPVVAPYNLLKIYPHNQPSVARDLKFFTDLSGFFRLDLFQAHHYSFIPGTFYSWFYDAHNIVIPVQPFSKAGALLGFISFGILILFFLGLYRYLKQRKVEERVLLIYLGLLFVSYIMYNFQLPYYSTVKGAFLTSGVIPFVYFCVKGIRQLPKKFLPFVIFYLVFYVIIVVKNFWILDWWY